MPYVKPALHASRIASTALKTFNHGGIQTFVAATQSSNAAQNFSATPLADNFIGRFRKAEKTRLQNLHQQADNVRQASSAAAPQSSGSKPEAAHQGDAGLAQYYEAFQKHQKSDVKEWPQFQFAKRIEWQPPTTVPENGKAKSSKKAAVVEDVKEEKTAIDVPAPLMKRSYTTSALNDFDKAIKDDLVQAAARAQVDDALAEEVQKSKEASVAGEMDGSEAGFSLASGRAASTSPATSFAVSDAPKSEADHYADQLLALAQDKRHVEVLPAFQSMLLSGVQKPTPTAYRALLSSVLELTTSKDLKAPKALEVYSDMLKRRVVPDLATYGTMIEVLSKRAADTQASRKALESRLIRYGGQDESGNFMFRSNQSEYAMLQEDSSLTIAVKMFEKAARKAPGILPSEACAALLVACAEQGRYEDVDMVYHYMETRSVEPHSSIYPSLITAFGTNGDLRNAVEVYDQYKDLAVDNNAGLNSIERNDNQVYAALIKAYGLSDRLKGGLKFLADIQGEIASEAELAQLREVVASQALLPLALKDDTFRDAFDLTRSLAGRAFTHAMATICVMAADKNMPDVSLEAFDALAETNSDLLEPATAMLAMHIRNANVEAAETYWRILESSSASLELIEPTTMRAMALIAVGRAELGLRHSRRMFARVRDQQSESKQAEAAETIDEAIQVIVNFTLRSSATVQPSVNVELLRMLLDNGPLPESAAAHIVAQFGPDQISRLSNPDAEFLLRVQASMILEEAADDIAGPARFGCLLETVVSRSIMPTMETEDMIEKTLINIDRPELSTLWNNYRYPKTPAFTPAPFAAAVPFQQPPVPAVHDTYDPYAAKTDVKGSNMINELLERSQGRRMNEALTKFRNMRRVGRVPRIFTYGKLIEAATKENNNLTLATDVLEMAKQDVPFNMVYRVVCFGWQQILDHMIAGCLNMGRRDLAASYHQDLLDTGAAPSANTFGLYITTLKENTKTFDEASEAVKIFQRAKAEGVEPSSFLYNALIGKLGKARRIDDCLFYFAEMRNSGVRPTSVTYGTVVNALCRVSDEKFAEEIFEEMESCTNYKPRPAPYHSLMQFFLTTKRDKAKVLSYYDRMLARGIEPTLHTYKLLIDTHATLEPINMPAAEAVIDTMAASNIQPEAVHYSSLIHAKGCVQHDLPAARTLFDTVLAANKTRPQPCLYQALLEALNANHALASSSTQLLADMAARHVDFTPYIANALIHGWTAEKDLSKAEQAFQRLPKSKREPSTYEAMVRAYLAAEDRESAKGVVREALGRGYPSAVAGKIAELVR
ncbi:hypothetical protein MBLNU230_g2243t1 [Neophaeotheca triangularis]